MCGAGPGDLGGSWGSDSAEISGKTGPKTSSQTAFKPPDKEPHWHRAHLHPFRNRRVNGARHRAWPTCMHCTLFDCMEPCIAWPKLEPKINSKAIFGALSGPGPGPAEHLEIPVENGRPDPIVGLPEEVGRARTKQKHF